MMRKAFFWFLIFFGSTGFCIKTKMGGNLKTKQNTPLEVVSKKADPTKSENQLLKFSN